MKRLIASFLFLMSVNAVVLNAEMIVYQERTAGSLPGDFTKTCSSCRYNPQTDELNCWCPDNTGTQMPTTMYNASKKKFIRNMNGKLSD